MYRLPKKQRFLQVIFRKKVTQRVDVLQRSFFGFAVAIWPGILCQMPYLFHDGKSS